MTVATLLKTYDKCWHSDKSTEFERSFIKSLVQNACKYCRRKFIPNDIYHSANRDIELKFSEKQLMIYFQIEERYNRQSNGEDLYHKYSKIFRENGVVLDSFDQRHLETFKGIFKESEMHAEQKLQVKMAFFGAIGQLLVLMENDVADLEEQNAVDVLESFKTQVANYYLSITTNQN